MDEEDRWEMITDRYLALIKTLVDGCYDLGNMDDEGMQSAIDNAGIEMQRIKELLN